MRITREMILDDLDALSGLGGRRFTFTMKPWPGELSHNKMYRIGYNRKKGRYMLFQTGVAKASIDLYIMFARSAARGIEWKKREKIWVKLMVYLPDHHWDASNFVKAVNDIVKNVVRCDDTWFSNVVDWEVDRENPRVEVSVWQNCM